MLSQASVAEAIRRAHLVWGDALFGGPWKGETELADAFVEYARDAAPDLHEEYQGISNAAYCIELCLADIDTDAQDAIVTSFLLQLPSTDTALLVRRILEHLPIMEEKMPDALRERLDTAGLRAALQECLSAKS